MRPGVRLGIDPGDARIGVARSDPTGLLATPVETVRRGQGDLPGSPARRARRGGRGRRRPAAILSGREGPAAASVREFAGAPGRARRAGRRCGCRRAADDGVGGGYAARPGVEGAARRAVVDQAAAVLILQDALDPERATGVHRASSSQESHDARATSDDADDDRPDGTDTP